MTITRLEAAGANNEHERNGSLLLAVALGAIAGLRSMSAIAWAAYYRGFKTYPYLGVLAAGEIVADKLPSTPNRISPLPLIFRCAAAAIASRLLIVGQKNQKSRLALSGVSAMSALVFTFGTYSLRKFIVKRARIKDPVVAVVEDSIMLTLGTNLKRKVA
jgi:uncharacterized membrane protein